MVLSRFPVVSAPAKQPEPQPVVLPSGVRCVVNFNTINKGQRFFATSIRGQELKKSLDWEFNPAGQFQFRLMGINGTSYNSTSILPGGDYICCYESTVIPLGGI